MHSPPPPRRFNPVRWLFDSQYGSSKSGSCNRCIPRWLFLRALALIYFSAFFPLLFQIEGLNGPNGILPAGPYLTAIAGEMGTLRFWYAPTLFWFSSSSFSMMAVVVAGLIASIAAFFNLWPRVSFFICLICFLSFVTAAQDFSSYQSDSMLLEAGFIALFFVPRGFRPGLGIDLPSSRASLFLLQWEWFRIYFESGVVKLLSGDPEWRNFTAMDDYYQNGPLPTWIGWYVQHLPHWFHAASTGATLGLELAIVCLLFLPGRFRLICFCIVTPWEIGVILTANYTFLNYLVLSLGILLLDDRSIHRLIPQRLSTRLSHLAASLVTGPDSSRAEDASNDLGASAPAMHAPSENADAIAPSRNKPATSTPPSPVQRRLTVLLRTATVSLASAMLLWIAYATTAELIGLVWNSSPLPTAPITALEPLRIANQYGLFAYMTRGRYEIEFQASNDGEHWIPYLFRFKPQLLNEAPGLYAPYQPRFEWNLWFASLGDWRRSNFVPLTEERLLENDPDVLRLFRGNPFGLSKPRYVKAVLWQYWFTSMSEKRSTGNWWRRELLGLYAPQMTRLPNGKFSVVEWPGELAPHN